MLGSTGGWRGQLSYEGHSHHFPEAAEQIFGGGEVGGEQAELVGSTSWREPGVARLEIKCSITTGRSKGWPCP